MRTTGLCRLVVFALGTILWFALPAALVHAQESPPPAPLVTAEMTVSPPAVAPGEALTYTLLVNYGGEIDSRLSISATLPAGFELPLSALPIGATYNLRSGVLNWEGTIPAQSLYQLKLVGFAPTDLPADGRLVAYAGVDIEASDEPLIHLSAEGWAGTMPSAGFDLNSGTLQAGQPAPFVNQSQGTGPVRFWWDFGDGSTSVKVEPSHIFQAGGEYEVRLTVANRLGASSVSRTVHMTSPSLEEGLQTQLSYGDILVNDHTPAVGQPVYFGNLVELEVVTVHWNFGDGYTSLESAPTHIFQEPGAYTVTRVLGEGAAAEQASRFVVVDYAPQASIQVANPSVTIDELITFTAHTSAPEVSSYYWDFGDGNTAHNGFVAHSYCVPGLYSATLSVSTDFGVALDTLAIEVIPYVVYLPVIANNAVLVEPPAEPEVLEDELGASAEPVGEAGELALPPAKASFAQQMLDAINAERMAVGLPPLAWSDQLTRSSQHHTDDMSAYGFTGHYGSNGSRPIDRMRQASYAGDYAGECTAWGFGELPSAVAWWMSSPPHRTIILSTVATDMGGAYSYNPNAPSVHYWTIDFGAQ